MAKEKFPNEKATIIPSSAGMSDEIGVSHVIINVANTRV